MQLDNIKSMLRGKRSSVTLVLLFQLAFFFIYVKPVKAEGEFATDYEITYEVEEDGGTKITQNVTLTNLTREYYAKEYSLVVSSTNIETVKAFDDVGEITPEVTEEEEVTKIRVVFNDRVVGLNKNLRFKISYKNADVSKKQGRIWEVNIPKLSESNDINAYNITVRLPRSFGPPLVIYPDPIQQSEDASSRVYLFDKEAILKAGAYLSFGDWQLFNFNLKYHLRNPTSGPILTEIALPPDIKGQQMIFFKSVMPKPRGVRIDTDGNYLAEYRLEKGESTDIELVGFAKVLFRDRNLDRDNEVQGIPESIKNAYTKPQRFWPVNDERIVNKAQELTKDKGTAYEKAIAIYDFVTNYLTYSTERINKDLERFGAIKALENKDQAVCMEYTDLYITLARASGIPAREIDGYAYTSNDEIRPTIGDVLHAWVEIYLPGVGWVPIDPTWGSTTKGLDFFNNFDTNHLAFSIKGSDSEWPHPAGAYKLSPDQVGDINVSFATEEEFMEFGGTGFPKNSLGIEIPKINLSGLPINGKLVVKNISSTTLFNGNATINAMDINPSNIREINIGTLPPFSQKEIPFKLGSTNFLKGISGEIKIDTKFEDFSKKKIIETKATPVKLTPFYLVISLPAYLLIGGVILLYVSLRYLKALKRVH